MIDIECGKSYIFFLNTLSSQSTLLIISFSFCNRTFHLASSGEITFLRLSQKCKMLRIFHPVWRDYFTTLVTTPDATVLPPSLTANLRPSSRAIGFCRVILNVALSPGITISTPSSSWISPVTSVVLKKNCGLYPLKNGV